MIIISAGGEASWVRSRQWWPGCKFGNKLQLDFLLQTITPPSLHPQINSSQDRVEKFGFYWKSNNNNQPAALELRFLPAIICLHAGLSKELSESRVTESKHLYLLFISKLRVVHISQEYDRKETETLSVLNISGAASKISWPSWNILFSPADLYNISYLRSRRTAVMKV